MLHAYSCVHQYALIKKLDDAAAAAAAAADDDDDDAPLVTLPWAYSSRMDIFR